MTTKNTKSSKSAKPATPLSFDAVIGNPPYQEEDKDNKKRPVYHHFYNIAFDVSDRATLISPGRFLFRAGDTPKDWTAKMLEDEHLTVVKYFKNPKEVFPNVDVKGGIAIMYRDANVTYGAIGFFSDCDELNTIKDKVWAQATESFSDIVYNRGKYRFSDKAYEEQPEEMKKVSDPRISTFSFERMPALFTVEKPDDGHEYIQIYGNVNGNREYRWFRKDYLAPYDGLYKYKVMIPKANGSGAIGEVLSTPLIGQPLIGHTETYISIGSVDTLSEAEAILKYVKSRFARCLLGLRKVTQDNSRNTWAYVPLQDFTESSDIPWGKSIDDIDAYLFAKYGLDLDERAFIMEKVRPME